MGYIFSRELVAQIKPMKSLCKLSVDYHISLDIIQEEVPRADIVGEIVKHHIDAIIPSGALTGFGRHRYLDIYIDYTDSFFWEIYSAFDISLPRSLRLTGSIASDRPLRPNMLAYVRNHSQQQLSDNLLHAMPAITHLRLGGRSWKFPWIADIPHLFPDLDTLLLDLEDYEDRLGSILRSLPSNLDCDHLILLHVTTFPVHHLIAVVENAGVQLLEFRNSSAGELQAGDIEKILRRNSVEVVKITGIPRIGHDRDRD